jgi:hypothetical protein
MEVILIGPFTDVNLPKFRDKFVLCYYGFVF